ncbi:MAG: peptide deformylase [Deltaproteobacteria bacterium]|jgi:peptide deformylase
MSLLEILEYPDEILSKPVLPVTVINGDLQQRIDDMAQTMYHAPGVGLAASQVGINQCVLVYDVSPRDDKRALHVLINPRIVCQEGEFLSENEGCLSVPEYRSDVVRFSQIQVEGVDRDGKPLSFAADGYLAVVLQHEIDHLQGVLFIDRISALKRNLYKKRIKKRLKQS